ncbi:hypothetical protein AB0346_09470 [Nocardia beijingensis]|uniref:hypothetical protein n=1 Tax=Nocardia beijingensis TaxID=95162 RepID=UPI00344D12DF
MFLTSMSLPSVPNAWMQVYTPTDEVAWGKLRALLAMSAEERSRPWAEHRELYHAAAG